MSPLFQGSNADAWLADLDDGALASAEDYASVIELVGADDA
jgi:hypothetical protein